MVLSGNSYWCIWSVFDHRFQLQPLVVALHPCASWRCWRHSCLRSRHLDKVNLSIFRVIPLHLSWISPAGPGMVCPPGYMGIILHHTNSLLGDTPSISSPFLARDLGVFSPFNHSSLCQKHAGPATVEHILCLLRCLCPWLLPDTK